jgi:hypothetical protein
MYHRIEAYETFMMKRDLSFPKVETTEYANLRETSHTVQYTIVIANIR